MKKQILFLTFFVLAILASIDSAFAQTSLAPASQALPTLSCTGNANFLHPVAGVSYTYQMDGTTGTEQADQWTWFATKDPDFITAGALNTAGALTTTTGLLATSANYNAPSGTNSVDITWSPEVLANTVYQGAAGEPTFVVGYATGTNCADNIQVYEINPIMSFIIDIAAIDESDATLAWDAVASECVSPVVGATYDTGTHALNMDYGTDTIYFEVSAANFVNDFTPTFRILSGLSTTQTADIGIASTLADAQAGTFVATHSWAATDIGGAGQDWATGQTFNASSSSDVATGVSLYVRVVIDNNTYESLTSQDFALAVDAIDDGGAGQWDMEDDDCGATPTDAADQVDTATQTINPRPTITGANVPDSNAAAPNDIVGKNP